MLGRYTHFHTYMLAACLLCVACLYACVVGYSCDQALSTSHYPLPTSSIPLPFPIPTSWIPGNPYSWNSGLVIHGVTWPAFLVMLPLELPRLHVTSMPMVIDTLHSGAWGRAVANQLCGVSGYSIVALSGGPCDCPMVTTLGVQTMLFTNPAYTLCYLSCQTWYVPVDPQS